MFAHYTCAWPSHSVSHPSPSVHVVFACPCLMRHPNIDYNLFVYNCSQVRQSRPIIALGRVSVLTVLFGVAIVVYLRKRGHFTPYRCVIHRTVVYAPLRLWCWMSTHVLTSSRPSNHNVTQFSSDNNNYERSRSLVVLLGRTHDTNICICFVFFLTRDTRHQNYCFCYYYYLIFIMADCLWSLCFLWLLTLILSSLLIKNFYTYW